VSIENIPSENPKTGKIVRSPHRDIAHAPAPRASATNIDSIRIPEDLQAPSFAKLCHDSH